jgi:uncharacterized protein
LSKSRADRIIESLGLKPLPMEGGYYVETYRSDDMIPRATLPERYSAERSICTAIYFLLTPGVFSAMHRLKSDEVYHFYLGYPVEMLLLHANGTHELVTLGSHVVSGFERATSGNPDTSAGEKPQVVVPHGVWQGARLREGGEFALLGATVAPGFEFDDYEHGEREALVSAYPNCERLIMELTRG